ncbi:molybdopterin molybdotransferase MoeA [Pseudohongiella sp. SYSU M77423]|uniref:molybdopterin molybdotransferase MoeA n=1 Tax=unclassified Pseudohongiella TaxID=2629611 RepID=UPI001F347826|nr:MULTISPECIES: gephyrin-like molybdotransferase Glp [unclassified Pseudohongiella]MDH7944654.1 molybdopterin molybdotransferase MoeA [Pseudohongiella sp. SYSU M77423]|tara:strand:- start:1422 stop:2648 length:1227 start_codon:yes stop_codon:yes gene_type:complete
MSTATLKPVGQVRDHILQVARTRLTRETIPLSEALGRILATDVIAAVDVPPWDNSAMDGYAIRVAELADGDVLPVSQRITAGSSPVPLHPGTAARIFTGAPVPDGADAVVMQENCEQSGVETNTQSVCILQVPQAGANVRRRGADIQKGELLFAAGYRLQAADLGLLASTGVSHIAVGRMPRVAILTTGDELVAPGEELAPGQIYNSNAVTLQGLLNGLGIVPQQVRHVADTLAQTQGVLRELAQTCDCIISSGGVSAGEEDHVRRALQEEGQLDVWKLALKPGKPFAFGHLHDTLFFGLPGNPVSSFVTFVLLVRPALLAWMGAARPLPTSWPVRADFERPVASEREEYLRVTCHERDSQVWVTPLADQSSGVLSSIHTADGLAIVPSGQTLAIGDALRFIAFSDIV